MRTLLLMLGLCVLASPAYSATAPGTDAPAGPAIAVLRLDVAIRNSKIYTARLDALKADKAEAEAQLDKMEAEISSLTNAIKLLNPTTDRFAETQEQIEVIKVKHDLLAKRTTTLLDRKHGAALKESYDVLRNLLQSFAKERGIKIIHLAPNPDLPSMGSKEMQMQLGLQSMLYYDPALDVTEAFVAFANSRNADNALTGTPPPPAGPAPAPTTPAPAPGP